MMKNKIYRIYLKFLYLGYSCFCFIFRPNVRGAYVIVTYKDKILLIKNSYKPGWTFPCGMIDKGETEVEGARRELFEEVGVSCDKTDLVFLRKYLCTKNYKKDHQFFFLLKLNNFPEIQLDMKEVIDHEWVNLDDFTKFNIPNGVKEITLEYKDKIFT